MLQSSFIFLYQTRKIANIKEFNDEHSDASERQVELKNGALWNTNRREEVDTWEKPPSSDQGDEGDMEPYRVRLCPKQWRPLIHLKLTEYRSECLHANWAFIKVIVEY